MCKGGFGQQERRTRSSCIDGAGRGQYSLWVVTASVVIVGVAGCLIRGLRFRRCNWNAGASDKDGKRRLVIPARLLIGRGPADLCSAATPRSQRHGRQARLRKQGRSGPAACCGQPGPLAGLRLPKSCIESRCSSVSSCCRLSVRQSLSSIQSPCGSETVTFAPFAADPHYRRLHGSFHSARDASTRLLVIGAIVKRGPALSQAPRSLPTRCTTPEALRRTGTG